MTKITCAYPPGCGNPPGKNSQRCHLHPVDRDGHKPSRPGKRAHVDSSVQQQVVAAPVPSVAAPAELDEPVDVEDLLADEPEPPAPADLPEAEPVSTSAQDIALIPCLHPDLCAVSYHQEGSESAKRCQRVDERLRQTAKGTTPAEDLPKAVPAKVRSQYRRMIARNFAAVLIAGAQHTPSNVVKALGVGVVASIVLGPAFMVPAVAAMSVFYTARYGWAMYRALRPGNPSLLASVLRRVNSRLASGSQQDDSAEEDAQRTPATDRTPQPAGA